MAESGQTVVFPMNPKEIAAEDAANNRLAAIRQARFQKPQKQVATFELAVSGIDIEFPLPQPEMLAESQ
jgi:hypothetical protein